MVVMNKDDDLGVLKVDEIADNSWTRQLNTVSQNIAFPGFLSG